MPDVPDHPRGRGRPRKYKSWIDPATGRSTALTLHPFFGTASGIQRHSFLELVPEWQGPDGLYNLCMFLSDVMPPRPSEFHEVRVIYPLWLFGPANAEWAFGGVPKRLMHRARGTPTHSVGSPLARAAEVMRTLPCRCVLETWWPDCRCSEDGEGDSTLSSPMPVESFLEAMRFAGFEGDGGV